MKKTKRSIRQEKLAKLFFEMGMDIELVSKISGVDKELIIKSTSKEKYREVDKRR